jgi:hypothetical protein
VSQEIRIEFTRFSAFYSPLIAAIAGGFLKKEGLITRRHRYEDVIAPPP